VDTCLNVSAFDLASADAGFKKAREYLRRFSLRENPSDEYKQVVDNSAQNWAEFLKTGLSKELAELLNRPYQWLRVQGEIEIESHHHGIELFTFPISQNKAGLSIALSSSVYDAIYSFKPPFEQAIDVNVKQDIITLVLLIASSFSVGAFLLRPVADVEDLVFPLKFADVQEWLVSPSPDVVRRWANLLVGIRAEFIERTKVEKKWPVEHLMESSTGFLILDGIH
jgi:hypothetical protein